MFIIHVRTDVAVGTCVSGVTYAYVAGQTVDKAVSVVPTRIGSTIVDTYNTHCKDRRAYSLTDWSFLLKTKQHVKTRFLLIHSSHLINYIIQYAGYLYFTLRNIDLFILECVLKCLHFMR